MSIEQQQQSAQCDTRLSSSSLWFSISKVIYYSLLILLSSENTWVQKQIYSYFFDQGFSVVLVCWFVGRITQKLPDWFPPSWAGGRVSAQNRPHEVSVRFWIKAGIRSDTTCLYDFDLDDKNRCIYIKVSGICELMQFGVDNGTCWALVEVYTLLMVCCDTFYLHPGFGY